MAKRICSIDGCDRPRLARGWCSLHWQRWQKHGTPHYEPKRQPATCTIEGCGRGGVISRGWCRMHYKRWMRHGDPLHPTPMEASIQNLWSKVDVRSEDECWEWSGYRQKYGYGRTSLHGKRVLAHRAVYEMLRGPIPDALPLDHLCRNPPCCNPNHLEPVTHRVNILRGEAFSATNARKTHCMRGHPLWGENLYVIPSTGGRVCRTCRRTSQRAYKERQQAK